MPTGDWEGNIAIDETRLFTDLMDLGKIGHAEGQGVSRPALSDADMAARAWLRTRMEAIGLEVRVDAAFNMVGVLRAQRKRDDRVVVIGSHLDTVPHGGMFDGALGVLAGLECVRFLRERGIELPWDLEIVNFTDEEGGHNAGTIGSRAMLGQLQEGELFLSKSTGISPLADEMMRHGGDPRRVAEAVRPPAAFRAMLELHIEQGKVLESAGTPIGVVSGIVGIYRYIVTVVGEAGHTGTTPMHLRNDALVRAAPLFTWLPEWVRAQSPEMVGTIGQLSLEPGAANVIPGECRCVMEVRSMEASDMKAIRSLAQDWIAGLPGSSLKTVYEKGSVRLSEALIGLIERSAEREGLQHRRMPSGAGHDAQTFAPVVPSGMIFIPCRGGVSHRHDEWAEQQDAGNGCRVLLRTLLELANNDSASPPDRTSTGTPGKAS